MKKVVKSKKKILNEGITLIALVVTIVVLLILAGTSIQMLAGEDGIITQAKNAKDKTTIGNEKDLVDLSVVAAQLSSEWGEITETNLEKELTINIGERDVDYTLTKTGDNYTVTYTETGNSYIVYSDGSTKERGPWTQGQKDSDGNISITNGKITVQVGDYVNNYNPVPEGKTAETVTSYSTENECGDQEFSSGYEGKWRILGVSEDGKLMIVPENVIKTTSDGYYYLKGQAGYVNAVSELDKISAIFGKGYGAESARSVRVEDINRVTGYNPNNEGVYDPNQTGSGTKYGGVADGETKNLYEYGNEVTYYWKGDNYPHYKGTNGVEENLTTDHATNYNKMFNWFDTNTKTWKTSSKATINPIATEISGMQEITKLKSTYYWYYLTSLTTSNSAVNGLTAGSKAYTTIYNGSGQYYWLGSPYIDASADFARFGVLRVDIGRVCYNYLFHSNGSTDFSGNGVRPAVILKSDIQLTGSSEGWTIK